LLLSSRSRAADIKEPFNVGVYFVFKGLCFHVEVLDVLFECGCLVDFVVGQVAEVRKFLVKGLYFLRVGLQFGNRGG